MWDPGKIPAAPRGPREAPPLADAWERGVTCGTSSRMAAETAVGSRKHPGLQGTPGRGTKPRGGARPGRARLRTAGPPTLLLEGAGKVPDLSKLNIKCKKVQKEVKNQRETGPRRGYERDYKKPRLMDETNGQNREGTRQLLPRKRRRK